MALIGRRSFAALLCSMGCTYCVPGGRPVASRGETAFVAALPRRGGPPVLVLMPDLPQTRAVWESLSAELGSELDVLARRIDSNCRMQDIRNAIEQTRPKAIVLMNNPTVRCYREYQAAKGAGAKFPPAVIVMASFLEEQQRFVENATGIAYELPIVTSLSQLRSLLAAPLVRVGVIYRPSFSDFVWRQRRLAIREEINLIGQPVRERASDRDVRRAIASLHAEHRVDALWVLNDNELLSANLLSHAWLPSLEELPRLPAVVGVLSLVSSRRHFGTFAVVPDHRALGLQAASMVFDIADRGWTIEGVPIQLPISIETAMDVDHVKKYFSLKAGAVQRVDHLVR